MKKFYCLLKSLSIVLLLATCNCQKNPANSDISSKYRIAFFGREQDIRILENIYSPKVIQLQKIDAFNTVVKWSPYRPQIAYIAHFFDPVYSHGLFTVDSNGSNGNMLTQIGLLNGVLTLDLTWSPDGSKIAFVSNINTTEIGEQNIWVIDANGQYKKQLTASGHNIAPFWFPDGQRIGFFHVEHDDRDSLNHITSAYYTVHLVTNEIRQFLPASSSEPAFSFDGRNIVYGLSSVERGGNETAIFWGEIDSQNHAKILDDSTSRVLNQPFGFSRDGGKILFASYLTFNYLTSEVDISTVDVDGSHRKVLKRVENLAKATLSPDGEKILLWIWRESRGVATWHDLYILSVDGSEYFKLIEEVRSPDWAPIWE